MVKKNSLKQNEDTKIGCKELPTKDKRTNKHPKLPIMTNQIRTYID